MASGWRLFGFRACGLCALAVALLVVGHDRERARRRAPAKPARVASVDNCVDNLRGASLEVADFVGESGTLRGMVTPISPWFPG